MTPLVPLVPLLRWWVLLLRRLGTVPQTVFNDLVGALACVWLLLQLPCPRSSLG